MERWELFPVHDWLWRWCGLERSRHKKCKEKRNVCQNGLIYIFLHFTVFLKGINLKYVYFLTTQGRIFRYCVVVLVMECCNCIGGVAGGMRATSRDIFGLVWGRKR